MQITGLIHALWIVEKLCTSGRFSSEPGIDCWLRITLPAYRHQQNPSFSRPANAMFSFARRNGSLSSTQY